MLLFTVVKLLNYTHAQLHILLKRKLDYPMLPVTGIPGLLSAANSYAAAAIKQG